MVIIFRGAGIVVPIVLFITGWIVSFWYKDARIGNPDFMGWTLFYTAIICLLLGLAFLGGDKETNEQGQRVSKPWPHFFFIPIILWGPIFGGISAYLLLGSGKAADPVQEEEEVVTAPVPRLHFYNPTEDTLDYLISSTDGLDMQEQLAPYKTITLKLSSKSYLLGSLDQKGEPVMTLPYYEDYDAKLYEKVKDGDSYTEHRLIRPLSAATNDYEDNWMLLDGNYDLMLVDVSSLYHEGMIQSEKIAQTDWMKLMKSYPGSELIELSIMPTAPGGTVYVNAPNTYLPVSRKKDQAIYALIAYDTHIRPDNAYIAEKIGRLTI